MIRWLTLLLLFITFETKAQAPVNDAIDDAINITNPTAFCSGDAAYSNIGASSVDGPSQLWNGSAGKDVWFKFTALKFDVNISVSGKINAGSINSMINPRVALYTRDLVANTISEVVGSSLTSNNVTSLYKGALTIGQVYYIRISAANDNEGTFKLCVDNFFPPLAPGQDCGTFSVLCSMEKFTQVNVTGAGAKNTESAGTCLGTESNSAWYKWTAAKDGTFTFLITPTVTTNDIDWILYDLGPGGDCSKISAATAIRCASGSGVTCSPSYYVTGLSMTETDLTEQAGCPITPQNGLVKYVDMIAGHNYALLVDNFSSGNNGFNIEFGGTTALAGPTSEINMVKQNECTPQQSFEFTSLATNYNSLKWTFGEGANITNATGEGPYVITYNTPGDKVVVLEAKSAGGCNVVKTVAFTVSFKPTTPTITYATVKLCPGNLVTLQTPKVDKATYKWTGPNGYTSTAQNPQILITGPENSGNYQLTVQVGNCTSDVATVTIPPIDPKPEALFDILVNNFCQANQSFTFKNVSLNSVTAVWDFGPDAATVTTALNGDKTVIYTTAGIKNITLTVTSPSGCVAVLTKQQLVQIKPATPVLSSNTIKYCPGNDVTLSTPAVANAIYHWSGPNNFTSTDQNPLIQITGPENSGDYQLIIQVGDCMSDPGIINLPSIDPKPSAFFEIVVNNPCMATQSYTFKNEAKNYAFLTWDFGSGVASSTTAANGDVTVIYASNGIKDIVLVATSPSGCTATFSLQSNVQLKPLTPVIDINRRSFCLGDTLKMSIAEVPGVTYSWTGPNNFTATTAAVEIPINDFAQAGTYQIVIQIGNCKSDVVSLTIPPIAKVPVASFTTTPTYYGKYVAPFSINFFNKSKDADTYLWDFGDGTTSMEANPKHTFTQSGIYKISLTVFADEGCSTSIDIGELIIKDLALFVPNAFSPNNDKVNDEFVVTVLNLKKYKIYIYNRAGEKVFESGDIFNNWNGKYKNQDVPVGVYYYVIYGTTIEDLAVKYTGSLTLIR